MAEKHIDGLTGQEFNSHEEYLNHVNSVTGFKPTEIEHHGVSGIRIAKAALKRTNSLVGVEDELNTKEANVRTLKIEDKIKQRAHKNSLEKPRKKRDRVGLDEERIEGQL